MENNNFKKKLVDLISKSKLTYNEKDLWELFTKFSTSEEDEAVFEAANESNNNLFLLTKHLRDKILHMKNINKSAWKKLFKEEEKYAEILENYDN